MGGVPPAYLVEAVKIISRIVLSRLRRDSHPPHRSVSTCGEASRGKIAKARRLALRPHHGDADEITEAGLLARSDRRRHDHQMTGSRPRPRKRSHSQKAPRGDQVTKVQAVWLMVVGLILECAGLILRLVGWTGRGSSSLLLGSTMALVGILGGRRADRRTTHESKGRMPS